MSPLWSWLLLGAAVVLTVAIAWWAAGIGVGYVIGAATRHTSPCPTCQGHRTIPDPDAPRLHSCPDCAGTGTARKETTP